MIGLRILIPLLIEFVTFPRYFSVFHWNCTLFLILLTINFFDIIHCKLKPFKCLIKFKTVSLITTYDKENNTGILKALLFR